MKILGKNIRIPVFDLNRMLFNSFNTPVIVNYTVFAEI